MFADITSEPPRPLPEGAPFTLGDIQYPGNVLALWSAADLAAIGVHQVVDDPIPAGQVGTASALTWDGTTARRVWALASALPPPVPEEIWDRQFAQGLAGMAVITRPEALDFVRTGAIPAALLTVIEAVPDLDMRFDLEMKLSGATIFRRHHPTTATLGSAMGWSSPQIDALWSAAAALD